MQQYLDDLIAVLTQVRSDVHNHHEHLMKNESATRTTLVDPVLRTLGWEIANPSMVVVEAPARRGSTSVYADYALRSSNIVKVIVEAKSLGQDLKLHRSQVVDYAFAFKINSVFLTNGTVWEHYTGLNPKHLEPTQVLNLEKDNLRDVAVYLVQELGRVSMNEQNAQMISDLSETLNELMMAAENIVDRISVLQSTSMLVNPLLASLKHRISVLDETLTTVLPASYSLNQKSKKQLISPLIKEVQKLMNEIDEFEETPTVLYELLIKYADQESLKSPLWPRGSNALTRELNKIVPEMKMLRIEVSTGLRSSGGRRITRFKKM